MRKYILMATTLTLLSVSLASAWWVQGHASIAGAAASRLPEGLPRFFRAAQPALAHLSGDPDRWKNPAAPFLRAAEAPDHFVDLEDFEGNAWPADRYQAFALLARLHHPPEKTGMLPYALMENYERLCCAFTDLRADPENPAIQAKCLVYAGILSHFTGDAAMPLHTTRNYDGRKGPEGHLVQRGIHARIDGFPQKHHLAAEEIGRGLAPRNLEDVWAEVHRVIESSHAQVDRCYELDAAGAFETPTEQSRAFILERCRAGAQFTLDLWTSAWQRSAKMTVRE
jgi:hypothetical protein